MEHQSGYVMTLANSIIGVSVLAMPYCFKQCGIILSILMLLLSSIISRLACHFLLKSAIISRRKTFENLAYYIFGSLGKFMIEISIAGFLIGTCVAFFVVIGDLTPRIISETTGHPVTSTLRTSLLMAMALFCVLPLGLLRNIETLNGVSKVTIGFYFCLVVRIIIEAIPHLFNGDWYDDVLLWQPRGIIQCLPIFAMALSCQTQLFEIYKVINNPSLEKMNNLVRIAVNICTIVYILVGVFGYIAFAKKTFTGNILTSLDTTVTTYIIKVGFVLSVLFSFPLVIFPSRVSLHSLLYKEGYLIHEGTSSYIPEGKFKALTMFIVFISLIIGILIPNIELVLGLVGSTIGVLICVVFPVISFIYVSQKNTNERLLAQLLLIVGILVMVLGTYENIKGFEHIENIEIVSSKQSLPIPNVEMKLVNIDVKDIPPVNGNLNKVGANINVIKKDNIVEQNQVKEVVEVRHEPPQPVEPQESNIKQDKPKAVEEVRHEPPQPVELQEMSKNKEEKSVQLTEKKPEAVPSKVAEPSNINELKEQNANLNMKLENPKEVKPNGDNMLQNMTSTTKVGDEVDIEAIKKEEREAAEAEKENVNKNDNKDNSDKNEHKKLIEVFQKETELQQKLVEQNQKLLEALKQQQEQNKLPQLDIVKNEAVQKIKNIESIALKAIEDSKNVVANLENTIVKNLESKAVTVPKNNEIKTDDTAELQNSYANLSKKIISNSGNTEKNENNKSGNTLNVSKVEPPKLSQKENNLNTAPYLLNLIKNDSATYTTNNTDKIVPLPIMVDRLRKSENAEPNNQKATDKNKNISDSKQNGKVLLKNEEPNIKVSVQRNKSDVNILVNNDSQVLRDILSIATTKR